MKKSLSLSLSILLLVLVAVGIIVFIIFHKKIVQEQSLPETKSTLSDTKYAAPGKLVDSFPANFVLDKSSTTSKSFDFTYNNNKQSSAIIYSKESTKTAYDQYKKYLTSNGYKIISEISGKGNSYNLYASGVTADVTVSINTNTQNKNTQITISYINK